MPCRCGFRKQLLDVHRGFDPDRSVYLDYNATTPVDIRVLGAFDRMCRRNWGNPSSLHPSGTEAWRRVDASRQDIGGILGVDPEGIRFSSSGTEGLHALLMSEVRTGCTYLTTSIEHSAIHHPLRLNKFYGKQYSRLQSAQDGISKGGEGLSDGTIFLPVDENGRLEPGLLGEVAERHAPVVLAYSPVNHETGGVQPVAEIYKAVKAVGGRVVIDAVQAVARLELSEWVPYCDAFALSGHKLYAPKGVGLIWAHPSHRIRPFRFGGGQEGGLFPGTENTPGIAAMTEAIRLHIGEFQGENVRLKTLTSECEELLRSKAGVTIESPENRVPGVLCVGMPWIHDMEAFMLFMYESKISVSRFSACTSNVTAPSRVLLAMGRNRGRASKSLRISLGRWSKREDLFALIKALAAFRERSK